MLRYRDGDAMRTKSTAILSSNRLLLLHTAHMSWLVRGLTPAANGQGAFLLRHLHLRTVANGTTKSTMPEYGSTTPLGRYFLAGSQVGVNGWLFFFNAERYLAAVGERWGGLSFGASTLPQFAEWSHAAGFVSARFFTAVANLVIAAETGVLSATPRAAQAVEQQSATSNLRGFMGAQRISQLFIHTAPDGYFLFYFASLLQPEDAGVNFSPAVKELAFRASSYSSYVTHVHLLRLLRTHDGVYTGGGFINLAPFVLFDAGCRAVWSEAGAASRTTAQLSGVRPYLDIYTYPLEHSAGRTASGDAWAAGAMPAGQSAVSLGLLFFGNLDAVAARASGALGARVVALANVPVRPSHTPESTEMMLAFRCTTHCAPPHPTHHHLPPATLPTGQRRLPTTVSPLSASSAVAFAAATRSPTTTHLPHSVPAPRVGGVAGFQGDFFTPTHANKTMPAAGLTVSLSVVGLLPYDGVDGTKPIRTVSGKLQDPAVFNFRLGDLPTGRVRFSNHLLLNWSLS